MVSDTFLLDLHSLLAQGKYTALTHGIRAINRTKRPISGEFRGIDYCAMRVARKRHPGTHRIHNVTRTWKLTWQFIYSTMRQCL